MQRLSGTSLVSYLHLRFEKVIIHNLIRSRQSTSYDFVAKQIFQKLYNIASGGDEIYWLPIDALKSIKDAHVGAFYITYVQLLFDRFICFTLFKNVSHYFSCVGIHIYACN